MVRGGQWKELQYVIGRDSFYLLFDLLCFASLGVYSVYGPSYSLPSEFLTGFAAASYCLD
jgi:hypothetical protein